MNSVDVPSLLRQMQMNMIMPSLLVPQQLGGLPSAAGMLNMNPDIINQEVIRASLGQPALSSPLPNQSATMPNIVQPVAPHHSNGAGSTGLSMQSSPHSQGIASHHSQGMTSEDQVVPASGEEEDHLAETDGGTAVLPDLDQIVDLPGIIDVIVVSLVEVVLSELHLTLKVN